MMEFIQTPIVTQRQKDKESVYTDSSVNFKLQSESEQTSDPPCSSPAGEYVFCPVGVSLLYERVSLRASG